MADANNGCEANTDFKEAVCIDAGRVFDSCCDRDCLEELRVYFSEEGQCVVNNAVSVKIKSAEVVHALVDVEPVNLSRGYYSCDITFFFLIGVDIYTAPHSCATEIKGLALFNKKVVLYGGEGNVRTFTSETKIEDCVDSCGLRSLSTPKCVVQAVDPIALSSRLGEANGCYDNVGIIPSCIAKYLGGPVVTNANPAVYVTIGLFTIVQLIRSVQVLVPVYDFCIPEKQCDFTADQPCDVFRRIDFPTDDFFPKTTLKNVNRGCGCGNTNNHEE